MLSAASSFSEYLHYQQLKSQVHALFNLELTGGLLKH
jgi:hypothetical protein